MKTKHSPNEIRTGRIREVRVATGDNGQHSVSGYAILYSSASVDLGGFVEYVAPGALTRTLAENPDVLCLRDHKQELLLGRTLANTLTLEDDTTGLKFSCILPATTAASDLAESLRRGDIDACSFMFACRKDVWINDAQGGIIRNLLDIDIFEISIASFPAYPDTSAALRSAPAEIRSALEAFTPPMTAPPEVIPAAAEITQDDPADTHLRDHLSMRLRLLEMTFHN